MAHEASRGSGFGSGKGWQRKKYCGKWKRDKEKPNGGNNNGNRNNFGNGVQKRVNVWMRYYKHKKFRWNNNHTSGFHIKWQCHPRDFCITVDHDYWKLSGTAPNHGTTGRYSGGGGTQGIKMAYQHTSAISELVQRHQGDSADSNFISFISYFYELMDHLKWLGMD